MFLCGGSFSVSDVHEKRQRGRVSLRGGEQMDWGDDSLVPGSGPSPSTSEGLLIG